MGLESVLTIHYNRIESSIKQPTLNKLASQRHVNWLDIYPKSSYKIMNPVSAALPKNLRRIFVATLLDAVPDGMSLGRLWNARNVSHDGMASPALLNRRFTAAEARDNQRIS